MCMILRKELYDKIIHLFDFLLSKLCFFQQYSKSFFVNGFGNFLLPKLFFALALFIFPIEETIS